MPHVVSRTVALALGGSALVAVPAVLDAQLRDGWDPFVEVEVPIAPIPVLADGSYRLAYELHVTNFAAEPVMLLRVEAWADFAEGEPIAAFEGSDLRTNLFRPGLGPNAVDRDRIDPGMRAIVYMWAELDERPEGDFELRHRLSLTDAPEESDVSEEADAPEEGEAASTPHTLEVEPIRIAARTPRVLGPPLRGDAWKAANGPSNLSGHRRAVIPLGGRARIAQRFAIDWVQLYDDGGTWRHDPADNSNYRCYGAEALAVADGVVVETKDGIPENVPGPTSRAVPITLETVGGNFVILEIGKGDYAFYAHLQPGSLRVGPGDRVRRGDVLGLVGNSGNSTEPHLHFHLADAPSPLGSEGVPYVLDSFEYLGRGVFWSRERAVTPERRAGEIPLANMVVSFP